MNDISSDAIIAIGGVSVRYGRMTAVDDVTLEVPRGSVYALLGRNGAGKTSLVRCLLGMQKPSRGRVRLFGEDVWRRRMALMARVGVVPEEPDAPPEMSAAEILRFCARLYPAWDAAGAMERLQRFHVPLRVPFGRLSKGQKREVTIASVLAFSPELLVLDDPTLGLDVIARKEMFEELVTDLADRGTTVFVTTHDLAGIESIADRVAILRDGRIVLDEEMEGLKSRFRRIRYPATPVPAKTVASGDLATISLRQWGSGVEAVVSNYDEGRLERFRAESGATGIEVTGMSLEEIFIALAGEEKGAAS